MAWCEADERGRRLVAAEAFAAGYGGIAAVAMATTVGPRPVAARAIKGGSDLLALNGWKGERQQIIVGHSGRGAL